MNNYDQDTDTYSNIKELDRMINIEGEYVRVNDIIGFTIIRSNLKSGFYEFDVKIKTFDGIRFVTTYENNVVDIEKQHKLLLSCFNIIELKEEINE